MKVNAIINKPWCSGGKQKGQTSSSFTGTMHTRRGMLTLVEKKNLVNALINRKDWSLSLYLSLSLALAPSLPLSRSLSPSPSIINKLW
jgi:hypothetical protein